MFGSDQGLVGQFNDVVTNFARRTLAALPTKPDVWAVGERVQVPSANATEPENLLTRRPDPTRLLAATGG